MKYIRSNRETDVAAHILACGSRNAHREGCGPPREQDLFAVRLLLTHVTFYRAKISGDYWKELEDGLPKLQSVNILRWPTQDRDEAGYDLTRPDHRKAVFSALVRIREHLLQEPPLSAA